MLIEIVPYSKSDPKSKIEANEGPTFLLQEDNWNDFGYYTSYTLYFIDKNSEYEKISLIGPLRIMKLGQEPGDKNLLGLRSFNFLPSDFYSLSPSLDYYQRISNLNVNIRNQLLSALKDLIVFPDYRKICQNEDVFKTSLMRDLNNDDDVFTLGPVLLSGDYSQLMDLDLNFSFFTPELENKIEFNFSSPSYGIFDHLNLPNRICVLIGRNGSGKSTLLSRISRIAFSPTEDRNNEAIKLIGQIMPLGLGFPRILFFSYSAFDSFQTPGVFKRDKEQIVDEMETGTGRFIFCGIRDIVKELEGVIPNLKTDADGRLLFDDIRNDRIDNNLLKSLNKLGEEFCSHLNTISDLKQDDLLLNAFGILSEESSMHNLIPEFISIFNTTKLKVQDFFKELSTGHKFVFHAITGMVAYCAPRSLILFDEPETHLHPPILAAFMKAIRYILNARQGFMILATHSPVILQETLSQHIFIIRRENHLMKVTKPRIETFGENIGILTSEAFGLNSDITDYHNVLDDLLQEYGGIKDPQLLLNKIDGLFKSGLSMQARSYILSKIYQSK
ncbi:AAA family ATPase [Sphingobacterium siyangense]|uniref:AAA family ATPase n=1 Tax=Sphingobacterium siyangense TaxID=459529 RepID=UPI003DA5B1CC